MQHFGEADYEIEKAIAKHSGLPYIAKDCNCWDGYKRVPGTKPCAPGSCEKCDSHSKESAKSKTAYEYTWTEGNPEPEASRDTQQLQAEFENWFQTQPFPDELRNSCLGSFDQAYMLAKEQNPNFDQLDSQAQLKALIEEVFRIWMSHPDQTDTVFPPVLGKKAAQGDKPSPNAAKDVLHALEAGDNDSAKALLGNTDCPEECEVHAEGKCNHGFMSAGRTRVRYLVDNDSLGNDAKTPGTIDHTQVPTEH